MTLAKAVGGLLLQRASVPSRINAVATFATSKLRDRGKNALLAQKAACPSCILPNTKPGRDVFHAIHAAREASEEEEREISRLNKIAH